MRATVRAPAATGREENPQAEVEAHPEGYRAKHKRQPADGIKCKAGGLVTVPSVREEQRRGPRTPEESLPQRGPPEKNAPVAAGRYEGSPTEALTPSGRI